MIAMVHDTDGEKMGGGLDTHSTGSTADAFGFPLSGKEEHTEGTWYCRAVL